MKPGARRAEFDWSETPYPTTVMGQTDSASPSSERPIAVLWVPDPEQRHGLREFYVYPDAKPSRPVGFRKP